MWVIPYGLIDEILNHVEAESQIFEVFESMVKVEKRHDHFHEAPDLVKVNREEVGAVREVNYSHHHCACCRLVPGHLESESLPTFTEKVKICQQHSISEGYN